MQNQIEIFQGANNEINVEVKFEEDTVWLTQAQMVELFGQTKQNVSLHINNCFKENELDKKSTVKESLTVGILNPSLDTYNSDFIFFDTYF